MSGFFFICEYLNISPRDFFDMDTDYPKELQDLIVNLKKLDERQLHNISGIVEGLVHA